MLLSVMLNRMVEEWFSLLHFYRCRHINITFFITGCIIPILPFRGRTFIVIGRRAGLS